jgi:predicted amidohydrolase
LAQVSASPNKVENLERAVGLIQEAADRRADLLVIPELFMAYFPPDVAPNELAGLAEPIDGPFVSKVSSEAARRRIHVAVGLIEKSSTPGKVHNTIAMIGPDGRLLKAHRKLQLFDSFGYKESNTIEPAAEIEGVFSTSLGRFGMMSCYELRFPEIARILALQGAELIVVPTAWVAGRAKEEHLHTLAKARALENTLYVAVATQTGRIFTGRSLIVDPFGIPVCDAGEEECLVTAEIDPGRIERVRSVLPSLSHIRYDVYSRYLPKVDEPGQAVSNEQAKTDKIRLQQ